VNLTAHFRWGDLIFDWMGNVSKINSVTKCNYAELSCNQGNFPLCCGIFACNVLLRFRGDYRRGLDWWVDLLTTYTYNSELQVITALSLICTLYESLHPKCSPTCNVLTSRCLVTNINGDSSASVLTALPAG
jgi:hypothetical protein